MPKFSTEYYNDFAFDLVHIPAAEPVSASPSTPITLLMIPGNPSIVGLYLAFCTKLAEKFPAEVFILGHLAQSSFNQKQSTTPTLIQVVEQKKHFIKQLLKKDPVRRIVLVSHSIGSWMALQILDTFPQIQVCVALFPTLSHMVISPNGIRLAKFFHHPLQRRILAFFATLLAFLPSFILLPIISFFSHVDNRPVLALYSSYLGSSVAVRAFLNMADEEMRTVTSLDPIVAPLLKANGNRLRIGWAQGTDDGWVLPEAVGEIKTLLKQSGNLDERYVVLDKKVKHAFVLEPEEKLDWLATQVVAWITKDLCSVNKD